MRASVSIFQLDSFCLRSNWRLQLLARSSKCHSVSPLPDFLGGTGGSGCRSMKRYLVIALCAAAALLAATMLLLSQPAVQRKVMEEILGKNLPGTVKLEQVRIRFGQAEFSGLYVLSSKGGFRVGKGAIDFDLWRLLSTGFLDFGRIRLNEVIIDLSGTRGTARPQTSEVERVATHRDFRGLARTWEHGVLGIKVWPDWLKVDRVELEGTVELPHERSGRVHIEGRELKVAGSGSAGVDFEWDDGSPGAPVARLQVHADLAFELDAQGRIETLTIESVGGAEGPALAREVEIEGKLEVSKGAGGEQLSAELFRSGRTKAPAPIATLDLLFDPTHQSMTGRYELEIEYQDLLPFLSGLHLPVFGAQGSGELSVDWAREELLLQGNLRLQLSDLNRIHAGLNVVSSADVDASFHLTMNPEHMVLKTLDLTGRLGKEQANCTVSVLQAFQLIWESKQFFPLGGDGEVARVRVDSLPIAWIPLSESPIDLTGDTISASLLILASKDEYGLASDGPFLASGLSLSYEDRPLLEDVELDLSGQLSYRGNEAEVEISRLAVNSALGEIVHGAGTLVWRSDRGEWTPKSLRAGGSTQLAELSRQPLGAAFFDEMEGVIAVEAEVDWADSLKSSLEMAVRNITQASRKRVPYNLDLAAELVGNEAGQWSLVAPLQLNGIGESDIIAEVTYGPTDSGGHSEISVSGTRLHVDDIQGIVGLFSMAKRKQAEGEATETSDPETIFRFVPEGQTVDVKVSVGQVDYQSRYQLNDVVARFTLSEENLSIEQLSARIEASPLEARGVVRPSGSGQSGYDLDARYSLREFNLGEFLMKADPGKPAMLEGIFDVNGNVRTHGSDLASLLDKVEGSFALEGAEGRFRGLRRGDQGSEIAAIGSLIGGIIGYTQEKPGLVALSSLTSAMRVLPYDHVSLKSHRKADDDLIIESIEIEGPEIHLSCNGRIKYRADLPLLEQEMVINCRLGVRGEMGRNFFVLDLLGEGKDERGYWIFYKPFEIRGTLSAPDTRPFWGILANAGYSALVKTGSYADQFEGFDEVSSPEVTDGEGMDSGFEEALRAPPESRETSPEEQIRDIFRELLKQR